MALTTEQLEAEADRIRARTEELEGRWSKVGKRLREEVKALCETWEEHMAVWKEAEVLRQDEVTPLIRRTSAHDPHVEVPRLDMEDAMDFHRSLLGRVRLLAIDAYKVGLISYDSEKDVREFHERRSRKVDDGRTQ